MSVNERLTEKLHKSVYKKLKRKNNYARFIEFIWAGDLAEIPLPSKNKNVKYLLSVLDVSIKYAWV